MIIPGCTGLLYLAFIRIQLLLLLLLHVHRLSPGSR